MRREHSSARDGYDTVLPADPPSYFQGADRYDAQDGTRRSDHPQQTEGRGAAGPAGPVCFHGFLGAPRGDIPLHRRCTASRVRVKQWSNATR